MSCLGEMLIMCSLVGLSTKTSMLGGESFLLLITARWYIVRIVQGGNTSECADLGGRLAYKGWHTKNLDIQPIYSLTIGVQLSVNTSRCQAIYQTFDLVGCLIGRQRLSKAITFESVLRNYNNCFFLLKQCILVGVTVACCFGPPKVIASAVLYRL